MDDKTWREYVLQVARNHSETPENVEREMQLAIIMAVDKSKADGNEYAINWWSKVPRKGEYPTPQEFVEYTAAYLKNGSGNRGIPC